MYFYKDHVDQGTSLFLTAVFDATLVQEAKTPPGAAATALKSWDGHWHGCPGKC